LQVSELEQTIGHQFSSSELVTTALTHRSFGSDNNERLEFLGDSVLSYVITEYLYITFPQAREGQLSRIRAQLVKGVTLAELAREFDLGRHIRLGIGEKKSGGDQRESILADAVEALIGAIHLDAGFEQAKLCVLSWFDGRLKAISLDQKAKDSKSQLQELLQARQLPLPEYTVSNIVGAAHDQRFYIECLVPALDVKTEGAGSNRKKAEQQAAASMLKKLEKSDD
jgi:ribonuclease-3